MRPSILFPLFADIRTLSGVGPKLEKLIAKVAGPKLVDLVFDLPVGVVDRSYRPRLIAAEPGRIATVEVGVLDHFPPRVKSQPYKVRVSDDSAAMDLVFFRADAKYLLDILPPGSRRIISGRIESFKDSQIFSGVAIFRIHRCIEVHFICHGGKGYLANGSHLGKRAEGLTY